MEKTMSMADRDGFIWMDGKLVPWREAQTHVLTHSLHYGLSIFEGVRAYKTKNGTAIFRLNDHTNRFFESAHIVQMPLPFDRETINNAQKEVIRANNLDSGYIRPLAFFGADKMGVSPKGVTVHVIIAAWPWGAYLGEDGMKRGIRVKVSSYTRLHVNVFMVRAKVGGNYVNSILANNEVTSMGYDEAVLLDAEGFVAEGSGENIFIVKDGVIYTPDLASCLNGITRRSVITLAEELGYAVVQKRISRDEVYTADEMFFSGTAAEITPIREVDDRQIGIGSRGPVTEKLQKRFFEIVEGSDSKHADWLFPV